MVDPARGAVTVNDITPAALARWRRTMGAEPTIACVTCGAAWHGNIGCERCVLTWTNIRPESRWWLLKYAQTRVEWRPGP